MKRLSDSEYLRWWLRCPHEQVVQLVIDMQRSGDYPEFDDFFLAACEEVKQPLYDRSEIAPSNTVGIRFFS